MESVINQRFFPQTEMEMRQKKKKNEFLKNRNN